MVLELYAPVALVPFVSAAEMLPAVIAMALADLAVYLRLLSRGRARP